MTHVKNLHNVLTRIPMVLEENFITDDYVNIKVQYKRNIENYSGLEDEYLLILSSPWWKYTTTYSIYVPLHDSGTLNVPEFDKLINQIEPAILKDYNFYKEQINNDTLYKEEN